MTGVPDSPLPSSSSSSYRAGKSEYAPSNVMTSVNSAKERDRLHQPFVVHRPHAHPASHIPIGRFRGLSTELNESGWLAWSTTLLITWSSSLLRNTSSCPRISTSYPALVRKSFTACAYDLSTYRLITAVGASVPENDARARNSYAAFPNIVRPVSAWRVRNARTTAASGRNCCKRRSGLYAARKYEAAMGCVARHVFDRLMMVRGLEKEKIISRMTSITMMRWPREGRSIDLCADGWGVLDACCTIIAAAVPRRLRGWESTTMWQI